MRFLYLSRFVGLASILLLVGEGCIFGQTTGPANNAQLPTGTLLTQGPPPADCGQRTPNKLQAYFTIPDSDVFLGDPITLDASCTVGRIASLQWDFDFESWPAATPGDQRFQGPITISQPDLRSPSNDQPAGGWPINNLSPFSQAYTPQALGTHTARLLVTDHVGNQQLVIHTYNVTQSGQAQLRSATAMHRPHFVLFNGTNDGNSIAVPRQETRTVIPFYISLPYFNASAFGTSGDIEAFEWTIRRHGTLSGVVGTETDRRDPRRFPGIDFVVSRNTNDGLQIIDNVIPQADLDRGFGELAMINTFNPRLRQETEETIDFSIELRTTSQTGEDKTFSERYTLMDASTVKTLRPQLALIPGSPQTILQTGGQLDAWQPGSVAFELDPGQTFWLENYSVYPISKSHTIPNAGQLWNQSTRNYPRPLDESRYGQVTGQIIIEMDPGAGVYNEVGRMQSFTFIPDYKINNTAFDLSRFYENSHYIIPYTAPVQSGVYTARLRLTQSEVPGLLAAQQAETTIKFRVREPALPAPAVPVPQAPPTAQSAPAPQAPITPAPVAPAGVRAEVNPISQTGQVLSAPIHPDDILQFLARGVSVATMQRVEWDFDGDGTIDETCNVTEPYAGAGWATCQSSAKAPPQAQGNHTARLTIVPKTGAPYNVTVQYNVVPDDRAAAAAALPIPSISPELYAENKNGVRMSSNPEIYQNDSIIFLLNGLTEVAKKVQYDFENDGTYDVNCDVRQNQGQLQCLLYRRVSWRTAPGDYVARIKVIFAGSAGQLDFVLPYSVVRGERPADRNS